MQRAFGPTAAFEYGNYDSQQLDMFKAVLEEAILDLRTENNALAAADQIELTKVRLASAIFHFSVRGERSPARLKEFARAMVREPVQGPTLLSVFGHA